MPYPKSKKVLIYFILFIIIGTLSNKNLKNINLVKVNEIQVTGLEGASARSEFVGLVKDCELREVVACASPELAGPFPTRERERGRERDRACAYLALAPPPGWPWSA